MVLKPFYLVKITKVLMSLLVAMTLSVNAEWIETDKGLYKILELDGAKIISVNSVTKNSMITLTTITTNSGIYRCYETVRMYSALNQEQNSCYVLRAD